MRPTSTSTLGIAVVAALSLLNAPLALAFDLTEAGMASVEDPTQECSGYAYPDLANALAAGQLPPVWVPVQGILPADTEGQAKFASFKDKIPNIAPKGVNGTLDPNITYDGGADPDCYWTISLCTQPKIQGLLPDIFNVPEPNTLGYGFDDGPNCSHNAFYDYLQQKGQKATMFYIGSNVYYHPLQAQRAVADGHEIAAHSWSHREMTAFTNEQAFGELWYTMRAIKIVTGYTPTYWRPPQGDVDDRIRFIAQQLGLQNVLWKYNSNDWAVGQQGITTETVQANYDALAQAASNGTFATAGAIILAHELNNYTMQTALDNYPKLAQAFKYIVPISTAINRTHPYVETNFSMPSFAQAIGTQSQSGNGSSSSSGSSGQSGNSTNAKGAASAGQSAAISVTVPRTGALAVLFALLGGALCL